MITIKTLSQQFSRPGKLVWIGLRPKRQQPMVASEQVMADSQHGLIGDRYAGRNGKRQVTLFQHEHIAVIQSFTGQTLTPEKFRRNLVIQGINLLSLKGRTFQLGDAILQMTGLCQPCSQMEKTLGIGGYNAMRGHGGITARVIESGIIRLNDELHVIVE